LIFQIYNNFLKFYQIKKKNASKLNKIHLRIKMKGFFLQLIWKLLSIVVVMESHIKCLESEPSKNYLRDSKVKILFMKILNQGLRIIVRNRFHYKDQY
jgi:hypothetical protein